MRKLICTTLSMLLFSNVIFAQQEEQEKKDNEDNEEPPYILSLEELMDITVVTASNKDEQLSKAPATIIVITNEEIQERGYLELYDVLNDLPGFDLSRAFGDDDYYGYVRGYRKTTSDQMLLMIDGIIMNHLYNNNMNAYSQYPMANIKQIEIVYGPASAIYGPNAFSGVINIITKKDGESDVRISAGQNNTNIIDMHLSKKTEDLMVNFTGRLYQSDGHDFSGRTSMMEEELFTDPYLWGAFAQTNFTGYNSPSASNFIHPTISFKGLTVGHIGFFHESGLGSEFAGGTSLNAGTWQFKENTTYAKYETGTEDFTSKTLIKYRRSDIPGSSTFLWRWLSQGVDSLTLDPGDQFVLNGSDTVTNNSGNSQDYITDINYQYAEYWQANNASYSLFQDFAYTPNDDLTINFGLKYERRVLNRDYVINTSEVAHTYLYEVEDINRNNPLNPAVTGSFPFPDRPDDATIDQHNHNTLVDRGAYVQARWDIMSDLTFFGGLRYDYNSVWKEVISPRIGLVYKPVPGLVTKAFYGTAFLEPSARILYGGWQGSLSNDNLVPEKMRTLEVSGSYTKGNFSGGINAFYNTAPDAIGEGDGDVPINLGERRMIGAELNGKFLIRNYSSFLSRFRSDLYVSYINSEEDLAGNGDFVETGNMAPIKVRFILTAYLMDNLVVSLQNRYISEIKTVSTNPLGTIDAHFVSDANIQYKNLFTDGLSFGVKIYNWMNVDYFHPGYRNGDAGEQGVNYALLNTSWYSSRLPQPERTIMFNLGYTF